MLDDCRPATDFDMGKFDKFVKRLALRQMNAEVKNVEGKPSTLEEQNKNYLELITMIEEEEEKKAKKKQEEVKEEAKEIPKRKGKPKEKLSNYLIY